MSRTGAYFKYPTANADSLSTCKQIRDLEKLGNRHERDWVFWQIPSCSNELNWNFEKYRSWSISSCPAKKNIPLLFIQQKILFDDQTGSVVKEIYHSILFIPLILFNLAYLIESCLYWWNISKTHSKTKEQTHQIHLNSAKIQVLMRTNKISWCKWHKTVEQSGTVTTIQVHWEQYDESRLPFMSGNQQYFQALYHYRSISFHSVLSCSVPFIFSRMAILLMPAWQYKTL